jgi:hypothetical protein
VDAIWRLIEEEVRGAMAARRAEADGPGQGDTR